MSEKPQKNTKALITVKKTGGITPGQEGAVTPGQDEVATPGQDKEREINKAKIELINNNMIALSQIFNKELVSTSILIYINILKKYDIDKIKEVFNKVLKTAEYFPAPAVFIKYLETSLEDMAEENWASYSIFLAQLDCDINEAYLLPDSAAVETLRRMGGIHFFNNINGEKVNIYKKPFILNYKRAIEDGFKQIPHYICVNSYNDLSKCRYRFFPDILWTKKLLSQFTKEVETFFNKPISYYFDRIEGKYNKQALPGSDPYEALWGGPDIELIGNNGGQRLLLGSQETEEPLINEEGVNKTQKLLEDFLKGSPILTDLNEPKALNPKDIPGKKPRPELYFDCKKCYLTGKEEGPPIISEKTVKNDGVTVRKSGKIRKTVKSQKKDIDDPEIIYPENYHDYINKDPKIPGDR
jgi:hypothetical protein